MSNELLLPAAAAAHSVVVIPPADVSGKLITAYGGQFVSGKAFILNHNKLSREINIH